jgi:galactokinase
MQNIQPIHHQQFAETFGNPAQHAAIAPGRIEFIGNHTDYNGGRVIGLAVEQGILAMGRPRTDQKLLLKSLQGGACVTTDINCREPLTGDSAWVNYPLGVIHALRDAGANIEQGFELLFDSDLPAGAGMSSSAALELATAILIADACGFETDRETLVKIARAAENNFVGVPCGILDQGVSAFGKKDHLVGIDCQACSFTHLPLPKDVAFWVFNTGKKHSLVDSLYSKRHAECLQAFQILAAKHPYATCLSDLSETDIIAAADILPAEIYKRALHVVGENARVDAVKTALDNGDLTTVGKCLFASHGSSRDYFENSIPELDYLVAALRETQGVFGARLTGGGFGGAVMALTHSTFDAESASKIIARYQDTFDASPTLIHTHAADGARLVQLS